MASEMVITTDIDRDRRAIDVSDKIAKLQPSKTPFLVVLKKMTTKPAKAAEVVWFDQDAPVSWTQINNGAGYADSATSIVVDSASHLGVNDIIKIPRTGETLRITAISTATLTVVRSIGAVAAAAIVDDDYVVRLGTAMAEGSTAPTARKAQPTKLTNYCQIFRTTLKVTGTEMREGTVTSETERRRLAALKAVEHAKAIEYAALFGEKSEDTSGDEPRRTMGGLTQYITTNVTNVGGTLSQTAFDTALQPIFQNGESKTRVMFAGNILRGVINGWAAAKLETMVGSDATFGTTVKKYLCTHGDLIVVPHPLLDEAYFSGWGIVVDPEGLEWAPLLDTKYERNLQANDADYILDEYFTEATIRVRLEKSHGLIKGVTGAA